jgi:hypothetical protein
MKCATPKMPLDIRFILRNSDKGEAKKKKNNSYPCIREIYIYKGDLHS